MAAQEESMMMAKAVNMAGGHAELILFPELPHNCWDTVYADDQNYAWMFSFTADRKQTEHEELRGDY